MGHRYRANYIIKTAGVVTIHYDEFGSSDIPLILLLGPERFAAFASGYGQEDELLSQAFCQGAVWADYDRAQLLFFERTDDVYFCDSPGLRAYFLPFLQQHWLGWEIYWADYRWIEHHLLGLAEPGKLMSSQSAPYAWRLEALDLEQLEGAIAAHELAGWKDEFLYRTVFAAESQPLFNETVLTVRDASGQVGNYALETTIQAWLMLGSAMFKHLLQLEPLKALPKTCFVGQGAWIDQSAKTIALWTVPQPRLNGRCGPVASESEVVNMLQRRWLGYQVSWLAGEFPAQVQASQQELSAAQLSERPVMESLADLLSVDVEQLTAGASEPVLSQISDGLDGLDVAKTMRGKAQAIARSLLSQRFAHEL